MKASWNQKANLLSFALDKNYMKIHFQLERKHVTKQPMTEEFYKKLRNHILFNRPQAALKMIELIPDLDPETLEEIAPHFEVHD